MKTQQLQGQDLLSGLIAFDADGRAVWPAEQLHFFLVNQLAAPVSPDGPIGTFGDLLHHASPPLELLYEAKDFAKHHYADRHSPLPPEVCLLLYYGCILVARMRLGQSISRLEDSELQRGASWAIRQPWLDDQTRALFIDGLSHLRRPQARWRT